ncbi:MAG: hypothetical protein OQJ89_10690, partial [Kangiellaceae bacterium]|nr:hypothetical protein [Kangiellaceae bacterium]
MNLSEQAVKSVFKGNKERAKTEKVETNYSVGFINSLQKEEVGLTQLISGYLILVKANTLCMVVEQSGKKLAKLEFQASSILLSQRSLQTIQTFIEKLEPTTNQQSSLPLT